MVDLGSGDPMTAPRKLHGVALKPRVKIPPRRKMAPANPDSNEESFDILRKVIEEHRARTERWANR
jgi:hypothetical protein